jgi:NAD(P)-dependent dehydrogenase (short-subunit alcohol dehydrogenase family)
VLSSFRVFVIGFSWFSGGVEVILKGKVAFITGGGRGLGRSIALAMAREGAAVVIMSRTAKELREVVSLIKDSGGGGDFLEGDVSRPQDVSQGIDRAVGVYGGLDILVNNAAVIGPARFLEDADEAAWQKTLGTNLYGSFLCCRAAGLIMEKRGAGKIINVSSGLGQMPYPRFCAYAVSKAGEIQMTRSLAEEWRSMNIQVNAIDPGLMNTGFQEEVRSLGPGVLGEELHQRFAEFREKGLLKGPEKVAPLAVYLASPSSDHLSGHFGTLDYYRRLGWPG